MPSKLSVMRLPRIDAGTRNVVRYHHGTVYGLWGSMSVCTKFAPILNVVPGSSRRFIPKNGSRYRLSSTRAPTTVDGTVARYQSPGLYEGEEISAPSTPTFAED